ncbi:hypothetical protein ACFE04_002780 [Oxalis oulophora]
MTSLSRELVFLILQFLDEEKFKDAVHNRDRAKAVEVLVKDLKVFSAFNEELFKEITQLLTLENFRDNEQLSKYGDTKSARGIMLAELKKLIEANPLFRDKLQFPTLKNARLRTLINQSLNWQHQLCKNPKPNPDIKTLFVDHSCGQQQANGARAPSPVTNPLMGAMQKPGGFPPLGAHGPFQPTPGALPPPLAGWMASPTPVAHPSASVGPMGLGAPNSAAILKRPRTPPSNNPTMDYQTGDSEHVLRKPRPFGTSDEEYETGKCIKHKHGLFSFGVVHVRNEHAYNMNTLPVNVLPVAYNRQAPALTPTPGPGQSSYCPEDVPKNVVMTLNQSSAVKSIDFHPLQQILVLVGTNTGDFTIWDVGTRERLVSRNFKVWDVGTRSMPLQASLSNNYTASVNRVLWCPDGTLLGENFFPLSFAALNKKVILLEIFGELVAKCGAYFNLTNPGVAFSKHIVQLYSYTGGDGLRNHLEIEAHAGSVNDISFSYPNKQLCVVTCGDDKAIKVWDAASGTRQYTFEGHEAPIYSVCPHHKENIQFIFSTATDGKIKAWLYDNAGSRVDYDAPGHSTTTMAYSADGTRLFSCGTNKEGESYLVEWNESEGAVKHSYHGLGRRCMGIVQFDTTKNHFLVAGDDSMIKIWDMDNTTLLHSNDAEGGLPHCPVVRFNKEGTLLAVSTNDNGIKILANADGVRFLKTVENRAFDASKANSPAVVKSPAMSNFGSGNVSIGVTIGERTPPVQAMVAMSNDSRGLADVKPRIGEESVDKSRIWKLTEINEPSQCRSLRLADNLAPSRISRLIYTNSGLAVLALASNAVHKLWKWQRNDRNLTGKIMTTFMPPPPAATFLAFHPQDNNIIAIGMDDSTIQIYNVRVDEVKTKLKGHQKRVTGLAFSHTLNVLVSSGADSQLCVWSTDGWEKQTSKFLQIPTGRSAAPLAETRVQFHLDQVHLLVVHETQIAIYEAPKLECLKQWFPRESSGPITHATYSCDSQSIYVSLEDGSIDVLTASSLRLRCRINPAAYLPSTPSPRAHPLVIAAHPSDPNQFALGLSDGGVHVLEPLESEGKWGISPPTDNGAGPSTASGAATGSEQPR